MRFVRFLASRLFTYFIVVWVGVTTIFLVPRFLPSNPVEAMVGRITAQGAFMQPEEVEALRNSLMESFGLKGTLPEQYFGFLRRVILTGDFGPSLAMFPTPVTSLVVRALPWSLGLLLASTFIAWLLGNGIGLLAGYRRNKTSSKFLEMAAMMIYPMPYYILALSLIILLAYVVPIFPFSFNVNLNRAFSPRMALDIAYNSALPALSIVLVGMGWWIISMKALSSTIADEDFVYFARLKGVSDGKIMTDYVARNAMLPQVTILALQIGGIFSGALVTEILFGYPGIGSLIYTAVLQSDYNLMLGTISLSIIAVATATLIVDLIYPFLDPRIRYQ